MTNIVAFIGDNVTFPLVITKPNELGHKMSLEGLATEYGFILPIEYTAFSILDHIEGCMDMKAMREAAVLGMLLTPSGKLYEYRTPPRAEQAPNIIRRRLLYAEGFTIVRASGSKNEEQMTMAIHITNDLAASNELMRKVSPYSWGNMHVCKVQDLLDILHAKGFTEDKPLFQKPPERTVTHNGGVRKN